ncbi:iron-sulfur cluster repair di-iron protein [Pullulanibacillus camelliae]|uniref:Iron-sulfur cluster repair di-iron protein n=1 Tax=Pullulanibacillus camelliae TaxID=1707096 RepID=A0A8J3DWJ6_9BACL|nr:iron-sulfur cluster repair di-iron protein [Pullulanibacillus camelliae]GGE43909.1 iron-sulfur cluster repair di-iron protein [Pullulanibacillus camelliae]
MTIFTENDRTGEIVIRFPYASQLLRQYKIDFCCSGDRRIGEVIQERELDGEKILNEINAHYEEQKQLHNVIIDWKSQANETIINHIIDTHHNYLRSILPELEQLTLKVAKVHGKHHPELIQVQKLFKTMQADLLQHITKEETYIFPKILDSSVVSQNIGNEIALLEDEHSSSGALLKSIHELTDDFTAPMDACNTFKLTYLKLDELERNTFNHIHLENNILFPRFH